MPPVIEGVFCPAAITERCLQRQGHQRIEHLAVFMMEMPERVVADEHPGQVVALDAQPLSQMALTDSLF